MPSVGGFSASGVQSLNALAGIITLSAGANITLTKVAQNIAIAASGGGGGGAVDSVFGRVGAVIKASHDYDATAQDFAAISATSFAGPLTGNVTGNVSGSSGSTTGNAATATLAASATILANARTIAGNSFDGSVNVAFSNKFIAQGTADAGLSAAQFLGALATGIIKNTTTTGVLSIAIAADFPTLNQNTSGTAASFTGNLTGPVTSTGMATAIANGAITNAMLATLSSTALSDTANMAYLNGLNVFTAMNTFSSNGAASTASILFSGSNFTGGTGTTAFPKLFVQPTGATAVTTWNTAGTQFGVNSGTGFTGNFLDFHVNGGVSVFGVDYTGALTQAGRFINTVAGAASAPALSITGAPFAGTGTTSFPLFYLQMAGATASTTLSTAGTMIGVNTTTTSPDLINLLALGSSKFKVTGGGDATLANSLVVGANLTVGGASVLNFSSKSVFSSSVDGLVLIKNASGNGIVGLNVGTPLVAKTGNYTVLYSDSNTLFTNTGAAGEVDFTLPVGTVGTGGTSMRFTFYVAVAQTVKIIASGSDVIEDGATASIGGGSSNAATIGNFIEVRQVATGKWAITGKVGIWTTV